MNTNYDQSDVKVEIKKFGGKDYQLIRNIAPGYWGQHELKDWKNWLRLNGRKHRVVKKKDGFQIFVCKSSLLFPLKEGEMAKNSLIL